MAKSMLLLHRKACQRPEVQAAVDEIKQTGADLSVRITWDASDLETFVLEGLKSGHTRFIAGGGDGTVNGVANALMNLDAEARPEMGVMPLGTANDFARGSSIPLDNLTAALRVAVTADTTPIDIGVINGKYFVNVASGGFGAEITANTPRQLKAALGGAAYTLVGLARVWQLVPYRCRVVLDDTLEEELEVAVLAVGNNRYAGGGYDVAAKADLTDGLLDFAAITPAPVSKLGVLSAEFIDPARGENRYLRYARASKCLLESDRPLQLNLDGEPMIAERFEFSVCPGALRFALG